MHSASVCQTEPFVCLFLHSIYISQHSALTLARNREPLQVRTNIASTQSVCIAVVAQLSSFLLPPSILSIIACIGACPVACSVET